MAPDRRRGRRSDHRGETPARRGDHRSRARPGADREPYASNPHLPRGARPTKRGGRKRTPNAQSAPRKPNKTKTVSSLKRTNRTKIARVRFGNARVRFRQSAKADREVRGGSQLLGWEQSRRCRCGISGTAFNPKKGERPWLRMIL